MPHILCKFHEPFIDKILLPSLSRFTGSSSICFSFSYPKIYISHCICRQHTLSAIDSFKSKFSLNASMPSKVEAGLTLTAADERWNAFGFITLSSRCSHSTPKPATLQRDAMSSLSQRFALRTIQASNQHYPPDALTA